MRRKLNNHFSLLKVDHSGIIRTIFVFPFPRCITQILAIYVVLEHVMLDQNYAAAGSSVSGYMQLQVATKKVLGC